MTETGGSRSARWWWTTLFALAAVALVVWGHFYSRREMERIRQQKYEEISSIAHLKCGEILRWRRENLIDLLRSADSPLFRKAVQEWLQQRNNPRLQEILSERLVMEKAT